MLRTAMEEQTQTGFVGFDLAAKITNLDPLILRKLVRDGVLDGEAPWRTDAVLGYCDIEQAKEIASKLEAARRPVEGHGILVSEAAKKYRFSITTIYRWQKLGWVHIIEQHGRKNRLLNEGDIAFARCIADITQKTSFIYPPHIPSNLKTKDV